MSLVAQVSVLALALVASAAPTLNVKRQSANPYKRGVAYNYDSKSTTPLFIGQGQISWAHDWDSDTYGSASGVNYIPTLWGTADYHTANWQSNAQAAIQNAQNGGYNATIFSFNEPDIASQANMSPQDAASAWMQYIEPFAGQAALCAPSISNGVGPGLGFDWLNQFLSACSSCTINCINIHWYSQPDLTQYFQDYINQAASNYSLPIYLTEFAGVDTSGNLITDPNQINPFLQTVLPFLDQLPDVAGYAYFMAAEGLLVQNGELSGYGSYYVNYNDS